MLEPGATTATTVASLGGMVDVALIVLAAVVGVSVLVATVELWLTLARSRKDDSPFPLLSVTTAHRVYSRVLFALAPAAVAGAVTLLRTHRLSTAALLFWSILLTAAVLRSGRPPLHLMPIARYAFNAFVPAAGIGVALAATLLDNELLDWRTALAALSTATVTTAMAALLENRFQSDRPVHLAVIGSAGFAEKLRSELDETGIRGYRVVGHLSDAPQESTGVRWLGPLRDVRHAVSREAIDLLVVGPHNPRLPTFEEAAQQCLDLPVRMIEATALYEDVLGHVPIGTINSAWFQFIMHPRYSPSSPLSKRILDLVVSSLLLGAALPVFLLCAAAVWLEDRGPVFYRQRRVGERGREFDMLKFRTMRVDADELRPLGHTDDKLVTKVGRILRMTHLNELPQLVQVLKGEMSLVGPRPEPPALVEELSRLVPYYERRALVKPGVTGWAQVRCGYAGSHYGTAWKMCHDLYYIKHRSAAFDMLILLQTFHVLVERDIHEEQLPAEDFILGEAAELVPR